MSKYTLTKNYSAIKETYGILQNISSDSNIEVTNDVNEAGIVLKPFQTVNINQTVFARKIGNTGTCSLVVLPFQESEDDEANTEGTDDEESDVTFDEYGNLFINDKPHCHHHDKHHMPPLSVQETPHHYLVSVSKESLKGQSKFLIQFDDKKKG